MSWLRDNNTHLNKPLPLFETAEGLEIKRLEAKIVELESRLPTPSLNDLKADAVRLFVSETIEVGQFSGSDCQWLTEWVDEYLENKLSKR